MIKSPYSTSTIKRKILTALSRHILEDLPVKELDRIPLKIADEREQPYRCCVYKDRAILKYRIMAALGFAVEDEKDELTPLAEYLMRAKTRTEATEGVLTVISEACSSCPGARYYVSEICRGCVARPCEGSCPRDAVTIRNGRSTIDLEKCIKCGKCAAVCPYGAIHKIPVPCEEDCPVGAISKDERNRESIDFSKCISCGKCMTACPFGAITDISHITDVLLHIKRGTKLAAIYAPSIAGQYPGTLKQIEAGLYKSGFTTVTEAASGADRVTIEEGNELLERLERGDSLMTTSCCPAFVETVRKHVPDLLPMVSHTPSPMEESARQIKGDHPDLLTVFIGPCTAKKSEAAHSDAVDYVLSFEELGAIFMANGLDIGTLDTEGLPETAVAHQEGRGFAVSGGVYEAVLNNVDKKEDISPFRINGLTRKEINKLKVYAKGRVPGNFLEVMACEEGCIGGPGTICPTPISLRKVKEFAGQVPSIKDASELGVTVTD